MSHQKIKRSKKIVCMFDYGRDVHTGYATVSGHIVEAVKKYFGNDVLLSIAAVNYFGVSYSDRYENHVFPSMMMEQGNPAVGEVFQGKDNFGFLSFMDFINRKDKETGKYIDDIDGIFIMQDWGNVIWTVPLLQWIKEKRKQAGERSFKSVIYFPVDGMCHPQVKNKYFYRLQENASQMDEEMKKFMPKSETIGHFDNLDFFDKVITYTEYGRSEILKHRPDMKGKISVIPHGTDDAFKPLSMQEIDQNRIEFFGEANANKTIICNINRNQPRKDIPATIFGFIEAKETWPEHLPPPFLYLHMNPDDPKGWDLRMLLSLTNLKEGEDYKLIPDEIKNHGASIGLMNLIFNICDIFLTTALGGGWELTVSEAFACGLPVICPAHTSMKELAGNGERAFLLAELEPVSMVDDNVIRYQCNRYEIAEKLIYVASGLKLYGADVEKRNDVDAKLQKAIGYANQLSWSKVGKQWIDVFKQVY